MDEKRLTKRFWSKVKKSKSKKGCWLWTGREREDGYGIGPRGEAAHRVAYELTKGLIPKGLFVCHTCDNRPCVRPDHLKLGTNYENQLQAFQRGRLRSPWFIENVEVGLKMEKKYGRILGAKQAKLNYKRRKLRADKNFTARLDKTLLAQLEKNLSLVEGVIRVQTSKGKEIFIPMGGRALFYEHRSEDGPIIKRPNVSFDPLHLKRRKELLQCYGEILGRTADEIK